MMKINVLIDNEPGIDASLYSEHGLSFYIDTGESKVLCDMGASDKFMSNALQLGINLAEIDFAFVSHGHADHTGGLWAFLDAQDEKKVYLSNRISDESYFSCRRGEKREISTNKTIFQTYLGRLKHLHESCWLTDKIAAVYTNVQDYSQPYGNRFLSKKIAGEESADDFKHELSLAIRIEKGLVIVS